MSFKQHNHSKEKQYTIRLTSNNGNTVGFVNLSQQFVKAVLRKDEYEVTANDVLSINYGDFATYLSNLDVVVEDRKPDTAIAIEDY